MRKLILSTCLCLAPFTLTAQETAGQTSVRDRDFLTAFLEDNLSGLGRQVTIEGFQGALSSRATFSKLTIADDDGVWITINDGAIGWNRTALLSGRVEVEELSAAEIDLPRAPHGSGGPVEFTAFSLPELPVSISVGSLSTERLVLGADLLGQKAVVRIAASGQLSGGEGSADFSLKRIDGKEGELTLKAAFANSTRIATIDLLASEGPGGVAATKLGLPGTPSARLALHGSGPTDNFVTDLALATDGTPRLTGTMKITAAPSDAEGPKDRHFLAHLEGDIAPLLQPQHREFFGSAVTLDAEGVSRVDGRTDLTRLVLDSDGLDLSGRLSLSPDKIPMAAAFTARFGVVGKTEMLLPIPGEPTFVQNGTLLLRYDAAKGNGWTLTGDLEGFRRADIRLAKLAVDGNGRVLQPGNGPDEPAKIDGTVGFNASGVDLGDPALNAAIGDSVIGHTDLNWEQGKPLGLRNLSINAGGVEVAGDLALTQKGLDVEVGGTIDAKAPDIARFSALAGRDLGGGVTFSGSGKAAILSRTFDIEARVSGRALSVGQENLDRLLATQSTIEVSARRDRTGITLRGLDVRVPALNAKIAGSVLTKTTDLTAKLEFSDLGALGNGYAGQLTADATLKGDNGNRVATLSGEGRALRVGSASVDRLLAGLSTVHATAQENDGVFALDGLEVKNPQLDVQANGTGQMGQYDLSARIADMALLVPGFPGELTVAGQVGQSPAGYNLNLSGTGPGNTTLKAEGTIATDMRGVDLAFSGTGQSAILNDVIAPRSIGGPIRFDLKMQGPPSLASLSGQVVGTGLRVTSPNERVSVRDLDMTVNLAGGQADLNGSAALRRGGSIRLAGRVGLLAPHEAAISIDLDHVRLHDPTLYDTEMSGKVTVNGPVQGGAVIGGAITLHDTEISVAKPDFAGGSIPDVTHVHTPPDVAATVARAGLDGASSAVSGGGKGIFGLDLTISSPARLFVRGFGLDAEMSGTVHLRGTTADVQPSGQFDLIRGRLNILGKRFSLNKGVVQLLGSFAPYISFSASADTFGSTATITVEGLATAPQVHFTSSSGLPEEEVISQVLFGNGLDNISAFQLAQLASAVATLSGRGGEGVIARLRKNFKLDDLDIIADENGTAALKAGKYLTDKLYSEGSVSIDGKSQIDLNLELNADVTLRGTVGTDGTSGVGVFFNKDY